MEIILILVAVMSIVIDITYSLVKCVTQAYEIKNAALVARKFNSSRYPMMIRFLDDESYNASFLPIVLTK